MPVIKLSDEEATAFWTEQIGKKHPFEIIHQEVLKDQLYHAALYSKQHKGGFVPLIVRLKIEFPYYYPRLKRNFNVRLAIRGMVDFCWDKTSKGDEIRNTYYLSNFYLSDGEFLDAETGKEYTFKLKNAVEVPNFAANPPIYRDVESLGYFLKYRLPHIYENLLFFIDKNKFNIKLALEIERPVNQQIHAL